MLSEKVIEKLSERLVVRIQRQNEEILTQIGKAMEMFSGLNATQAQQLAQILKYGGSYENILKKIAEVTKLNIKDIEEIFDEVAKENYYFAEEFYKYRKIDYIPYEENIELQEVVKAIRNETYNTFLNISRTKNLGFVEKDIKGNMKFVTLKEKYFDMIDNAVINVERGVTTFDDEMYKILKECGESGIKYINHENGKVYRLDSAVRRNMQEALTRLSNNIQVQFGETYGADGIEISVHENPAPDHEDVQGRQFTFEQYNQLQNGFDSYDYTGRLRTLNINNKDSYRPIGMHNCYHITFSVILGVNGPDYSEKELEDIKKRNNDGFVYEDKHYTNYEGTQMQRKLELQVRKLKDTQILAKASGNKELINYTQKRISIITKKYKEFSKVANLPTFMERMRVSEYKRVSTKK